jgi:hypothetical protein
MNILEKINLIIENEDRIEFDKKFIKAIEQYVDLNESKYLSYVIKNKNKISSNLKKGGILFRGMIVKDDVLEKIENGNFIFNDISS